MKICHIAIACFYIEGWAYQENILPKYHKKLGYDVDIITTRYTKDKNNRPGLRDAGSYTNDSGINVEVLDYDTDNIFYKLKKVRKVKGLYDRLIDAKPEIVFVHGCQFFNTSDIIRYKKEFPEVKIYVDQHGDYYNMPITGIKNFILQKVVFRFIAKRLSKYVEKFWGVTPWRVDYLRNVYGLPAHKLDLLVMGGESDIIDSVRKDLNIEQRRQSYNLDINDFVIVTGGKIDKVKNIDRLLRAFESLNIDRLKLLIFGSITKECEEELSGMIKCNSNINFLGWKSSKEITEMFLLSDLAVFPGTHSVLWEQAVACGIPLLVKSWQGMRHVDVGGNCTFLENASEEEITDKLKIIVSDMKLHGKMKDVAMDKGIHDFSYYTIAKKSIEIS